MTGARKGSTGSARTVSRPAGGDTVLVLADATDFTADRVCATVTARGARVFRVDCAEFPQRLRLRARLDNDRWGGELSTCDDRVDLTEIGAVYVRRPRAFQPPEHLTEIERWHAALESRYGLGGILTSLPVRWCNHPSASAAAAYKPRQLVDFLACGLTPPPTLITNDARAVREFAAEAGPLICKPIAVGVLRTGTGAHAVYTREVTEADLRDLRGVEYHPHLFQARTDVRYDIRLTVVANRFFAVRIDSGLLDWRADYSTHRYTVVDVPAQVRDGVRAYMSRAGLAFAAFDFAVTTDDRYLVYEVNAEGQFGWLEEATGVEITEAIADYLTGAAAGAVS